MHPDPAAARRDEVGLAGQRDIGHAFEEIAQLRVLAQALVALRPLLHIEQLGAARHKHRQAVAALGGRRRATVVVIVIAVIVLQQADVAHLVKQRLKMRLLLLGDAAQLPELTDGVMMAQLHFQSDIGHFVGDDGSEAPIFRVVGRDALQLVRDDVGDLLPQLLDLLTRGGMPLQGGVKARCLTFSSIMALSPQFFFQLLTRWRI